MARIYPDRAGALIKIQSPAERKLYELLRDDLPSDYVVFHSVAWLARDLRSGAQDGETDFIVAHPERGVLVLEVKGGRINYDGPTNQWYSGVNAIKDPFEQARRNKHSLLAKLKDLPYWRERWLTIGHAVAFPDVVVKHDLRLDAPQTIILDANDLSDLRSWVEDVLSFYRARDAQVGSVGQAGIDELVHLLSPSRELRAPLAVEFVDEEREIIRLTAEQFDLLDFLGNRRRVVVNGCAGSGKTTMSVEQAKRLAQQGFRVLLTCFNRNLAEYIRSDDSLPKGVDVRHFHGLCTSMANRAGLSSKLQQGQGTQNWYDRTLPDLLLEAVDLVGSQYDAIVVDEGQDIQTHWWVPLQYLLADPASGVFYVFRDDNQNIYQTATELPDGMEPFWLRNNVRNTQHIHRAVLAFYRSPKTPTAKGPTGRPPEILFYDDEPALKQHLRQALHRLTVQEGIGSKDIVLLTPRTRERSALWRFGALGNFRLTDHWPPGPNEIYCTSVYLFKGLESPVVIIAEVYPSTNQDMDAVLYVGCSRARNHLVVLADAALPKSTTWKLKHPDVPAPPSELEEAPF